MKTMRERFEELPEIETHLNHGNVFWSDYKKTYASEFQSLHVVACYVNGAWYAFQEQEKKIDAVKKMIVSLRNEFDLWSDDTESFDAIEAQIENLEELLNESQSK